MFEKIKTAYALNLKEKNIGLDIDASISEDSSIIGDPDKLNRMFTNLISNAIKYSKIGGQVIVGKTDKTKSIIFYIKDSGIGIPAKDREKIFQGYFRSANAHQATEVGTGLGLHYVRQIVEAHKGKIWYESEEGKGTTFYVELPKA